MAKAAQELRARQGSLWANASRANCTRNPHRQNWATKLAQPTPHDLDHPPVGHGCEYLQVLEHALRPDVKLLAVLVQHAQLCILLNLLQAAVEWGRPGAQMAQVSPCAS